MNIEITRYFDYIKPFKHLFKREPTKKDLIKFGEAVHLTFSDKERKDNLQKVFGEIKCQKCKKNEHNNIQ